MDQSWKSAFFVGLVAAGIFFLNLGVPHLWDEDEPKNAACTREMLERNDWVVPRFNYELRTAKPVLVYWFMMTAYGLFGVSEFAARFWSAVFGVATCVMTYFIGRRLFSPAVGIWGGIILASGLMFGISSRAATPDLTLIIFSTLSLCLYVMLTPEGVWRGEPEGTTGPASSGTSHEAGLRQTPMEDCVPLASPVQLLTTKAVVNTGRASATQRFARMKSYSPISWFSFVAIYAAMGLAVLAKGPVGVALPTLILMLSVGMREWLAHRATSTQLLWRDLLSACSPLHVWRVGWSLRPVTALVVVALVAVPWYYWVGVRTDGEWLMGFFGKHNVTRFVKPLEGHSGPIYYYLVAVMLGCFPWSIFLPLGVVQLAQRLRAPSNHRVGDLFISCWAGAYLVFFSLASTKLPSYVLPAYPALALITARSVASLIEQTSTLPRFWLRLGFLQPTLYGLLFLVVTPVVAAWYLPADWAVGWAGLILIVGGVWATREFDRQRLARAFRVFGGSSALFCAAILGITSVQLTPYQTSPVVVSELRQLHRDAQLGTFGTFEPSLAYYMGRPVHRLKSPEQVRKFLETGTNAFVLIKEENWAELQTQLSPEISLLDRRPRFLKKGELLLLGHGQLARADQISRVAQR